MSKLASRIPLGFMCASLVMGGVALADESDSAVSKDRSSTEKEAKKPTEIEEITVTGSYIKRTRTDGPQAVEVVDRADIAIAGIQSPVDLIEKLSVNAGSEFRSDAFKAGGQYGTANVNLRGLGLGTTLVLVDGRRQVLSGVVSNDGASFVDINNIPLQMIERVEVLKEGAAATYGSDAVAGVVNFITRRDFEGFELSSQFQTTTSDGQREQGLSGLWGWGNDKSHLQLFANYFNQNELESEDRSFTQANRGPDGRFLGSRSPFGFSSLGNPGALAPRIVNPQSGAVTVGATVRDPGCEQAGGVNAPGNRCAFEFADNFNLAENEQRAKYAVTFRHDFSEEVSLSVKWNYALNKIDDVGQSPSFPPSTQFLVPAANPGNFLGVDANFIGRPRAEADGTRRAFYDYRTERREIGLTGQLSDSWSYDTNLSYARSKRRSDIGDTLRSEFALALAGFGGTGCNFAPSTNLLGNVNPLDVSDRSIDNSQAGQGNCSFFVPGSRAFLNPALANDIDVINSFNGRLKDTTTTSLYIIDGVVSGELFELPAGPVGMAVGLQFRRETYDVSRNADSVRPDRFNFLAGGTEFNSDRETYAAFTELSIPVRSDLELQLALRYEDYTSSKIGSSVDPKISFRWQPTEMLGFRGGFSTTFRAPTLNQQLSERTENEVIRDVANTGFLPIDNRGSTIVTPEEADVYNFGIQFTPTDRINLSLDYFRIDFSDLVVSENAQNIVDAENRLNGALAGRCDTPGFQASAQITRDPTFKSDVGVCPINRIEARFVNQNAVITDGIDLGMTYDMEVSGFDQVRLTTNFTHLIQYDIKTANGTIKGAGQRNEANFARALPKWRANIGLNTAFGPHGAGISMRYVSSYTDDDRVAGSGFTNRIDDHTTYDIYYSYDLSRYDAQLQVGIQDLFNREPPFVNTDFNFDSRTADARGRRAYANMTIRF